MEHNKRKIASTKGRDPFNLIYYEACFDDHDARVREKILNQVWENGILKTV